MTDPGLAICDCDTPCSKALRAALAALVAEADAAKRERDLDLADLRRFQGSFIRADHARIAAEARVAALEEALRPFAAFNLAAGDRLYGHGDTELSKEDFDRARRAFAGEVKP